MTTQVVVQQTPPALHGPTDKEKKYDRQLRLWAASGQQALEDSHILLLNSGSGTAGAETLKNLVLPGIGKFTIADDSVISEADLGVNFFLDEESLGKSRAENCVKLLQELNPDVEGDWFPKTEGDSLQDLLQTKFTLILYSLPISESTLQAVQQYALEHKIPLLSIHSAGFYSYFRAHLPGTFPIIETHPDETATTDLRLLTPWDELADFVASLTTDISQQTAFKHGHIPYLALLVHYLAVWKEERGSLPNTYKEKKEFASYVAKGARDGDEENYDEAVAAVLKTVTEPNLSSSVKEVFDYQSNEYESKTSFWIIAGAIKKFYTENGQLPLPGSVPDMKAESDVYVRLQNIYKTKARKDVAEVLETVRAHAYGKVVDVAEVEAFCKNAAFIKLIRSTENSSILAKVASTEFENDQMADITGMTKSLLPIYLALNATSHDPAATSSSILATIEKILPDASSNARVIAAAEEVARAKGGELHNISAITGGLVAQEVIKIITKQYIPIDNICIFDGITSQAQVLRL